MAETSASQDAWGLMMKWEMSMDDDKVKCGGNTCKGNDLKYKMVFDLAIKNARAKKWTQQCEKIWKRQWDIGRLKWKAPVLERLEDRLKGAVKILAKMREANDLDKRMKTVNEWVCWEIMVDILFVRGREHVKWIDKGIRYDAERCNVVIMVCMVFYPVWRELIFLL